jgi:RNA polymerase sigma factor (sigma-70 family)
VETPKTGDVAALIARCNRGDTEAWEGFYRAYHGMVARAVRAYARHSSVDVEDLIQEVFLALFKALRRYDPSRPVEAYILEIARRVGISGLRKESALKRGGGNPGPISLNSHDYLSREDGTPQDLNTDDQETQLIKAQEGRFLRKALMGLSASCRELLRMRYESGFSYAIIAERLSVREGTLRVRVQRCLSSLAEHYGRIVPQEAKKT